MGSLRSMKTVSSDVERIERKLAAFKEIVEYLLSAFEQTGLPRDHKGQDSKSTLEQNLTGMINVLTWAFEGKVRRDLPRRLHGIYRDLYYFRDHFIEYEQEHGENCEPRNEICTVEEKGQDIAVLILARQIKQWDKEYIEELKLLRQDLKRALSHSLGHLEGRYHHITDILKPESIPTADLPDLDRDIEIIAVDKKGHCLVSEPVESVKTVSEIELGEWNPYG